MRARLFTTALAAWLALAPAFAQAPADTERWRELAELELFGELLADGPAIRARLEASPADPASAEAAALLARALFETRGSDEALALLEDLDGVPAQLERARILVEEDELEAADELLAVLAPRAGAVPEFWLLSGRVHARRGALEAARAPLERFLALGPRHPEAPSALHVLSQAALRRGDGQAARELAARAAELGQWLAYLRVRRLQVRESPDEPLPRLGLALVWMGAGELERAAGVLDELLARHPDHASGWFHRGEVHRLAGELDAARAAYDRAVELDENELLARHNRAVLARLEGRGAEARADFEWLVENHPDAPKVRGAHLELARLLFAAGEVDAARERYAAYLERGGTEALE